MIKKTLTNQQKAARNDRRNDRRRVAADVKALNKRKADYGEEVARGQRNNQPGAVYHYQGFNFRRASSWARRRA